MSTSSLSQSMLHILLIIYSVSCPSLHWKVQWIHLNKIKAKQMKDPVSSKRTTFPTVVRVYRNEIQPSTPPPPRDSTGKEKWTIMNRIFFPYIYIYLFISSCQYQVSLGSNYESGLGIMRRHHLTWILPSQSSNLNPRKNFKHEE